MTKEKDIKIYFRIPFTMYFIGRTFYEEQIWSKLFLFRKLWDGEKYVWKII